jgi:hypothetical protein
MKCALYNQSNQEKKMSEYVQCPKCANYYIVDANNKKCKCEQKGGFKMWLLGKIICYIILAVYAVAIITGAFGLIAIDAPGYVLILLLILLPAAFTFLLISRGR